MWAGELCKAEKDKKATVQSQKLKKQVPCKSVINLTDVRVSSQSQSPRKVAKAVAPKIDCQKTAEERPARAKEERTVGRKVKPSEGRVAGIKVSERKVEGNTAAKQRTAQAPSSEGRTAAAQKGRGATPRGYALPSQVESAPIVVDQVDNASSSISSKAIPPEIKPSSIDIKNLVAKGYWYTELVGVTSRTRTRTHFGLGCVKTAEGRGPRTETGKAAQKQRETNSIKPRPCSALPTQIASAPIPVDQADKGSIIITANKTLIPDIKPSPIDIRQLFAKGYWFKELVGVSEHKAEATCMSAINLTDSRVSSQSQSSRKVAKAVAPKIYCQKTAEERPARAKEERTVGRKVKPSEGRVAGIKVSERKVEGNTAAKQRTAQAASSEGRTAAAQKGRGATPRGYALLSQVESTPIVVDQVDNASSSISSKAIPPEIKPSSIDIKDLVAKEYWCGALVGVTSRTRTRTHFGLRCVKTAEGRGPRTETDKAARKQRETNSVKPSPCSALPTQIASALVPVDQADKGSIIITANKTLIPDIKPSPIDIPELFAKGYWFKELVGISEHKAEATCMSAINFTDSRVSSQSQSSRKVAKAVAPKIDREKTAEERPTRAKEERTVGREVKPIATEARTAVMKVSAGKVEGSIAAKQRTARAASSEGRTAAESIDTATGKGRGATPRVYALPSQVESAPVVVDQVDNGSSSVSSKAIPPEIKPSSIDIKDLVAKGYGYRELVGLASRSQKRTHFGLIHVRVKTAKGRGPRMETDIAAQKQRETKSIKPSSALPTQIASAPVPVDQADKESIIITANKTLMPDIKPSPIDIPQLFAKGYWFKELVGISEHKAEATCMSAINLTDARVSSQSQSSRKVAKAVTPKIDRDKTAEEKPTRAKEERTVGRKAKFSKARAAVIKVSENEAEDNIAAKRRTARAASPESRTAAESIDTAAQKGRGVNVRGYMSALPSEVESTPVMVNQADKASSSISNKAKYHHQRPSPKYETAEQMAERNPADKQRFTRAASAENGTATGSVHTAAQKGRETKLVKPNPCYTLPSHIASAPVLVDQADKESIIITNRAPAPDMKPSPIDIQQLFAKGYWFKELVGLNKHKTQTNKIEAGPSLTPQLPTSRTQERENCGIGSLRTAKETGSPRTDTDSLPTPSTRDKTVEQRKEIAHIPLPANNEKSRVMQAKEAFNSLLAVTTTTMAASESILTKAPITATFASAATRVVAGSERTPTPALSASFALRPTKIPVEQRKEIGHIPLPGNNEKSVVVQAREALNSLLATTCTRVAAPHTSPLSIICNDT